MRSYRLVVTNRRTDADAEIVEFGERTSEVRLREVMKQGEAMRSYLPGNDESPSRR